MKKTHTPTHTPTLAGRLASLGCCLALFSATGAQAADPMLVTYGFSGITSVGGSTHSYTGTWAYQTGVAPQTVYTNGATGPVQQGFTTRYNGAQQSLQIVLDNGERVSAGVGQIQINNIQQAEAGAQVPPGLSLQSWQSAATGTINGLSVFNMYLAFLPVDPNFNWDALDDYFNGNAEALLQANPALLPPSIDPALTGTAQPLFVPDLFTGGVFLGTNHALTNTVNTAGNFTLLSVVPEPAAASLFLLGLAGVAVAARRRRTQA
jgi:hypothetical protein